MSGLNCLDLLNGTSRMHRGIDGLIVTADPGLLSRINHNFVVLLKEENLTDSPLSFVNLIFYAHIR